MLNIMLTLMIPVVTLPRHVEAWRCMARTRMLSSRPPHVTVPLVVLLVVGIPGPWHPFSTLFPDSFFSAHPPLPLLMTTTAVPRLPVSRGHQVGHVTTVPVASSEMLCAKARTVALRALACAFSSWLRPARMRAFSGSAACCTRCAS